MKKEKITYDISDHQRTKKYLREYGEYYQRHNLPRVKTKIISMSTVINRNFYSDLRKRGKTHHQIMRTIQPERYDQFLEDILPVVPETTYGKKKLSLWGKIARKFKL